MTYYGGGSPAQLPALVELDEFLRSRHWSWSDFAACPRWLRDEFLELDRIRRIAGDR